MSVDERSPLPMATTSRAGCKTVHVIDIGAPRCFSSLVPTYGLAQMPVSGTLAPFAANLFSTRDPIPDDRRNGGQNRAADGASHHAADDARQILARQHGRHRCRL